MVPFPKSEGKRDDLVLLDGESLLAKPENACSAGAPMDLADCFAAQDFGACSSVPLLLIQPAGGKC